MRRMQKNMSTATPITKLDKSETSLTMASYLLAFFGFFRTSNLNINVLEKIVLNNISFNVSHLILMYQPVILFLSDGAADCLVVIIKFCHISGHRAAGPSVTLIAHTSRVLN